MAVGIIFEGAGVTKEQYEKVRNTVHPGNVLAAGQLYHAAGTNDSGLIVVEIWETQEAADTFFKDKLASALQEAKLNATPTYFQIINTMSS